MGPRVFAGLVLAAGAGIRYGGPKALAHTDSGQAWLVIAAEKLLQAGCSHVVVVLGAAAAEARLLLPNDQRVRSAFAADWANGMSASLRAGLATLDRGDDDVIGALLTLVDLPDLPQAVYDRVAGTQLTPSTLRQAYFGESPGHPAFIGRDHWTELAASVSGDSGAKRYLREHAAERVDCSDLSSGADVDER